MLKDDQDVTRNIDWITVGFFALFVGLGWFNIFSVVYDLDNPQSMFSWDLNSGKQLVWIGTSVIIIIVITNLDYKFYSAFAPILYGLTILILIVTIFVSKGVKGSHSWLDLGFIKIQPAEFAKYTTALMLSTYLGSPNIRIDRIETIVYSVLILFFPFAIILLQNETGSALVFVAFILVLYREGLTPVILVLGLAAAVVFIATLLVGSVWVGGTIGVIAVLYIVILLTGIRKESSMNKYIYQRIMLVSFIMTCCLIFTSVTDYVFNKILQEHQRNRILVLFDPELDLKGKGYNVRQSKIAIGSGEFFGKGYLNGTQTKLNYVPEQHTDFIFCTIGEEHGWLGSTILIILYILFLYRLIFLAERQKERFARVYGYSVVCIIFLHFTINIGMTIGVFPVIGIPLPFFSYGGSSLWAFTIMLFTFLKLDASRNQMLRH
jgi:rod shape determining protein RodA